MEFYNDKIKPYVSKYLQPRFGLPVREDDCSYVWNIPVEKRCEWVKATYDCTHADTAIQYATILFCDFGTESMAKFALGIAIYIAWLLYLFLILASTSDSFFCPSLSIIAGMLRLSDNIAGVTILAFGNGAPDIFTSMVADKDEVVIMFTELIGAGVFVTAVIAGTVAVIAPFQVDLRAFMRDCCFYVLAVCWISMVVRDDTVHLWEAASFVVLYVLFVMVIIVMQIFDSREHRLKSRIPSVMDPEILHTYVENRAAGVDMPQLQLRPRAISIQTKLDLAMSVELGLSGKASSGSQRPRGLFREFIYDINPIPKDDWKKANVLLKLLLIVRAPFMLLLQLFVPAVNEAAEKRGWSKLLNCFQLCATPTASLFIINYFRGYIGPVPIVPLLLAIGTVIGAITFISTDKDTIPKYHNAFAFLSFVAAMMSVYSCAQEVMAVLQTIGFSAGISDAMLGITLLAWGNSVGDLVSNILIAKKGFPKMGYAACFGGPMFNTLLGLGLTYGYAAVQEPDWLTHMRISEMAPGCIAFLLCSLTTSILYLNITGSSARPSYGYLLFTIYFFFIAINLLSEVHIIHPLGTDHRPD